MQKTQMLTGLVLGIIVSTCGLPAEAAAKSKFPTVNGCSTEQVQTPFCSSCMDQLKQDSVQNHSYSHTLFCNGPSIVCCTVDNESGKILNCRKPATEASDAGEVRSRGLGKETLLNDEDTAPPQWLTEWWPKWLKGEPLPKGLLQ